MFRKKNILLLLMIAFCVIFFIFFISNKKIDTPKDIPMTVNIATFDSGFGGFFTAKAIEKSSHDILKTHNADIHISHFGDTLNAPYGEKTPQQIAQLTINGVINALDKGADMVFIACNTASTQYSAVQQEISEKYPHRTDDVISIIDASVKAVKKQIDASLTQTDNVHFAILATPATIKSQAYLKALTKIYNGTLDVELLTKITQERWFKSAGQTIDSFTGTAILTLDNGKKIHIYQLAPANWVDLIEKEGTITEKTHAVNRDLALLKNIVPDNIMLDGIGEFCTHYPVFDSLIQSTLHKTQIVSKDAFFVKQAPLMAQIFEQKMLDKLKNHKRDKALSDDSDILQSLKKDAKASITISGDNIDATKRLARTIFPQDAEPLVEKETQMPQSETRQAQ
jgi:glutamate racemase